MFTAVACQREEKATKWGFRTVSPSRRLGQDGIVCLAARPPAQAGTTEPHGELVQHRVILPFRGTPLTVRNRTDG